MFVSPHQFPARRPHKPGRARRARLPQIDRRSEPRARRADDRAAGRIAAGRRDPRRARPARRPAPRDPKPRSNGMATKNRTVIVTGASQGIGAAVANLFLEPGYNVVANSRRISEKNDLLKSVKAVLI